MYIPEKKHLTWSGFDSAREGSGSDNVPLYGAYFVPSRQVRLQVPATPGFITAAMTEAVTEAMDCPRRSVGTRAVAATGRPARRTIIRQLTDATDWPAIP